MHSDDSLQEASERTGAFETDLESLVLTAFARGVPVEGTWEFAVPVADAPGWRVTVEKVQPTGTGERDAADG